MKKLARSPEAGLGADDEAAAVLVEVGELEFWARSVVVRRDVHVDDLGNNFTLQLLSLHDFLLCLTSSMHFLRT